MKKIISGAKAITIAISTNGHWESGRCKAAMPPITAMVASIAATIVMLKPDGSICSLRRTQSCRWRFSASGISRSYALRHVTDIVSWEASNVLPW